jgi:hypothetical protein
MDKNFKITPQNQSEKKLETYSKDMHMAIRDYCNNFVGLDMHYKIGGIEQVRTLAKGSNIKTFEEYLSTDIDHSIALTEEEATHPILIQKARLLDIFAEKINKHIDTMTGEEFEEGMKQVVDICKF